MSTQTDACSEIVLGELDAFDLMTGISFVRYKQRMDSGHWNHYELLCAHLHSEARTSKWYIYVWGEARSESERRLQTMIYRSDICAR